MQLLTWMRKSLVHVQPPFSESLALRCREYKQDNASFSLITALVALTEVGVYVTCGKHSVLCSTRRATRLLYLNKAFARSPVNSSGSTAAFDVMTVTRKHHGRSANARSQTC